MLSVAALLALGACGGKTPSNNKSSEPDQPSVDPYHYEDPEVNLSDAETANMEIDFDEIAETCMINPKAKTYIDAMEEQEKTLEKPYHFSSLYGPDDYAKIAAASDKGEVEGSFGVARNDGGERRTFAGLGDGAAFDLARAKAAGMVEQHADCDGRLGGMRTDDVAVAVELGDAHVREGGDVAGHLVVQVEQPELAGAHHGCARDRLGHGGEPHDGVLAKGPVGGDVRKPQGVLAHDLAVDADGVGRACHLFRGDAPLDDFVKSGKVRFLGCVLHANSIA